MTREIGVTVDQIPCTVVISDEGEALLATKAAGRAIVAVEGKAGEDLSAAIYAAPSWEDVNKELACLVARRHLGLPWPIGEGERLKVRELVLEDRFQIPQSEGLSQEERMFCSEEGLGAYIRGQYRFCEYGIWALVKREDNRLAGLGGVTQPRLPWEFQEALEDYRRQVKMQGQEWEVLELGYRIFASERRKGYATEACSIILSYCRQVLSCRVCALIEEKNQASRRLAENLGMKTLAVMEARNESSEKLLLYGESLPEPPDSGSPGKDSLLP